MEKYFNIYFLTCALDWSDRYPVQCASCKGFFRTFIISFLLNTRPDYRRSWYLLVWILSLCPPQKSKWIDMLTVYVKHMILNDSGHSINSLNLFPFLTISLHFTTLSHSLCISTPWFHPLLICPFNIDSYTLSHNNQLLPTHPLPSTAPTSLHSTSPIKIL